MMNNKSVLIIEDNVALREAYEMILSSEGFHVQSAENGEIALELLKKEGDPGVIFLDLHMPVMDGVEFLKRYKPDQHPNTEVIVFSNYDVSTEIDAAYDLGAKRYVLKARAAPKELVRIVKTVLS